MNKFYALIAALIGSLGGTAAWADTYSLVGEFNSWNNTDETTLFTQGDDGTYTLTGVTISAGGFKIIKDQAWTTQYGSNGSNLEIGTDYTLTLGEDNIYFANTIATYSDCTVKLTISEESATLNITGTEQTTSVTSWCVCGTFCGWDLSSASYFTAGDDGTYTLTMDGLYGEFCIYGNSSWNISLKSNAAGDYLTLGTKYELGQGSSNLRFENTATVYDGCTLTLEITSEGCYLTITSTSSTTEEAYSLTGSFNSWSLEANKFTSNGDGTYTLTVDSFSGDFKVSKDYSWTDMYGSNGNSFESNSTYALTVTDTNVATDGVYNTTCTFTLTVTSDGATLLMEADDIYYFSGSVNSWSTSDTPFTSNGDGTYTANVSVLSGYFKIVKNQTWTYQYGSSSTLTLGVDLALTQNGDDIYLTTTNASYSDCILTITEANDGSLSLYAALASGIADVEADDIKIATGPGQIRVTGTDDVRIYTLGGSMVSTQTNAEVAPGLYIVKAGGTVNKVIVK